MIQFEHVFKSFGAKKVLDDVSYHIKKGEVFFIVGPSGTGKSVSLKHMIGLLSPDAGRVLIAGEDVGAARGEALARIRARFGYLFQSGALLAWLNVRDNVALPLRETTSLSEAEIDARVADALAKVGLENDGDAMPDAISGGMRKRAGLARALVTQPEILLFDEPTSGLDPVTSRRIDALIADLSRNLGTTSVVVTHDLHSALSVADRIGLLAGGKLRLVATPEEFKNTDDPIARDFLAAQFITKPLARL